MHGVRLLGLLLLGWASVVAFRRVLLWPGLWARAIADFERQPVASGAVVFVGSSSIRFWETVGRDLAPIPALNRGFGGATMAGVNHYARRILARAPSPRAIVLYAGVNDLAWRVSERRVIEEFERFFAIAEEVAPGCPVYVLSLQRAPSRRRSWPRVRRVNERLASLARGSAGRVRYVDVASVVEDERGRPRRELFRADGIHMLAAGYERWTEVLRPLLVRDLGLG